MPKAIAEISELTKDLPKRKWDGWTEGEVRGLGWKSLEDAKDAVGVCGALLEQRVIEDRAEDSKLVNGVGFVAQVYGKLEKMIRERDEELAKRSGSRDPYRLAEELQGQPHEVIDQELSRAIEAA